MQKMLPKWVAGLIVGVLAVVAGPGPAGAENLTKPVKMVVPFPPGGPTDHLARLFAEAVAPDLEVEIIVENRPGEAGNIAAREVANAPADGSVLLFGTSGTLAINPLVYKDVGYDPLTSFDPVIFIGLVPNVLLVKADLPANSVADLIALEKQKPGELTFGSPGHGASAHLSGVLFNAASGADVEHVPHAGTGPALVALAEGKIDMTFTDALTALPYIQAGKLKALAVTTPVRSPSLPDVPTLAEAGLKDYNVSGLFGIVAPKGTPDGVRARLNEVFASALVDPAIVKVLEARGLQPEKDTRQERVTEFLTAEINGWRKITAELDIEQQ